MPLVQLHHRDIIKVYQLRLLQQSMAAFGVINDGQRSWLRFDVLQRPDASVRSVRLSAGFGQIFALIILIIRLREGERPHTNK